MSCKRPCSEANICSAARAFLSFSLGTRIANTIPLNSTSLLENIRRQTQRIPKAKTATAGIETKTKFISYHSTMKTESRQTPNPSTKPLRQPADRLMQGCVSVNPTSPKVLGISSLTATTPKNRLRRPTGLVRTKLIQHFVWTRQVLTKNKHPGFTARGLPPLSYI